MKNGAEPLWLRCSKPKPGGYPVAKMVLEIPDALKCMATALSELLEEVSEQVKQ